MDNWLSDRFGGDYRAALRRGKECWWWGWTLMMVGAIPFVFAWSFANIPRASQFAGLASAIPDWALFCGMVALDVGFALALAGWYLRGLSKRMHYSL